ncbi:hypothetical protein [Amycolatopsis sp. lyj-23]|uniref:hypothetical protein n=1 Tax=Amycolatopsis sp. lyj-23 TaxID=2789283 RepID=UPI003978DADF
MDDDYARKLRNWLRAEPGGTPDGTSDEREWLREIPEPASEEQPDTPDRWTVRGRLPETPADDDWVCPVIVLPVPRPSRENGCRMSGVEVRLRWPRSAEPPDASRMSDAEARSRWNHPSNANRRAQSPGDVDSTADRRGQSPEPDPDPNPAPMTEAEARSRWNHPANWHRRRAAENEQQRRPDLPGSC